MDCDLRDSVATSLGADSVLLPYVGELLADLQSLGSSPETIVELLRPHLNVAPARILDLGCGKGATLLALAQSMNCSTRGIDGYLPFIEAARKGAEEQGLAAQCEFIHGDIREAVQHERDYDAVLYLAVGTVLGPLDAQVAALRKMVRPGGFMVIDDSYRTTSDPLPLPEYDSLNTHDEAISMLTRHGDLLVMEEHFPSELVQAMNAYNNQRIDARAELLAVRYPELAPAFEAYVRRQEQECLILETEVADVHWLLQRRD